MKTEKKVFKWWWGWNPGKIEKWLEEEEAKGWNLVEVSGLVSLFRFEKGSKSQTAYRIDFQREPGFDNEYLQLFADAGWTMIHQAWGWYFWKQAYTTVKPEIFTDTQSLIERNRRKMGFLTALLIPQIFMLDHAFKSLKGNLTLFERFFIPFLFTIDSLLIILFVAYQLHNRKLKKSKEENI